MKKDHPKKINLLSRVGSVCSCSLPLSSRGGLTCNLHQHISLCISISSSNKRCNGKMHYVFQERGHAKMLTQLSPRLHSGGGGSLLLYDAPTASTRCVATPPAAVRWSALAPSVVDACASVRWSPLASRTHAPARSWSESPSSSVQSSCATTVSAGLKEGPAQPAASPPAIFLFHCSRCVGINGGDAFHKCTAFLEIADAQLNLALQIAFQPNRRKQTILQFVYNTVLI
jgi:hypothetical protein